MVGKLTFADDAMFVNGIPFVVSVYIGVNFTTVEYVIQRLNTLLNNYTGNIFQFYNHNGYTIKTFLVGREFELSHDSTSSGLKIQYHNCIKLTHFKIAY